MHPIKVFIMYAHEDASVRDRLRNHLHVQVVNGSIDLWADHEIKPGEDWDQKITEKLNQSELLILLLSADFFISEYINNKELPEALRRHEAGECRLVPVIARECDWEDHNHLGKIQALPPEGKPIDSTEWPSKDRPYKLVVDGIKSTIREISADKQLREDQKKQEAEEEAARKQREIDQAIKEKAEKTAYNKAKRNNTEQSWEDFLIAFPESQLLAEAQKNYNDLLNIRLEEEKRRHEEVESLQIEMERLANERELKSAADLHDKIWQQAENEQNIALYSNYLDRYPQGVNTPRAIEALGRLIQKEKDFNAWQEAGSQNSKTSFEKYLREFPQGLYALEANAAINNIQKTEDAVIHAKLWQQAKITNTTIVYQKYLNQYPHGEHANEAIKTLNELIQKEQDLSVWRKVKAQGTKTAYEAYLKEFPHGIYVDEANFALKPFLKEPLGPSITDMVFIKGVTFEMGDKANGPIHKVTLRSFYISKFQVTQADWRIIMGSNPADLTFKGCDQCPVEGVSWQDIQIFLAILNDKTGLKYRLPTEAEWEFAAQGGNKFNGQIYAGSNDPDEVAWYSANSNRKTHPVGQKKPNHLGLYDMSGNVSEWCADWYDDYPDRSQTDPLGPSTGFFRVGRGGAWSDVAADTAVRYRSYWFGSHMDPTLGFRLARTP